MEDILIYDILEVLKKHGIGASLSDVRISVNPSESFIDGLGNRVNAKRRIDISIFNYYIIHEENENVW